MPLTSLLAMISLLYPVALKFKSDNRHARQRAPLTFKCAVRLFSQGHVSSQLEIYKLNIHLVVCDELAEIKVFDELSR